MPLPSRKRHAALITCIAAVAALVIAALVGGSPYVERAVESLPAVHSTTVGLALLGASVLALALVALRRLIATGRARTRRRVLEATFGGEAHPVIRTRHLRAGLAEVSDGRLPRLDRRPSILVDGSGLSLWSGRGRPKRVAQFAWREIRSIRCDRILVGTLSVPVAVIRVRHDGTSAEVPVLLAGARATRYALPDEEFYPVVRMWKARHRAALAAEGLELPPLTSPLPVITPEMLAAAGYVAA
ncbi:hypothetical protein ACGGZK_02915 [Agromyces sp. MMS24-K17]|uniref:hypothetical protein n=1 Tax=Agromyces sp. MMS24-K17 TaxID=3372850 RepID=UPI003753F72D